MDLRLRRRILLFLTLVCSAAGAFADNTYHQKETDDYVTLGDLYAPLLRLGQALKFRLPCRAPLLK